MSHQMTTSPHPSPPPSPAGRWLLTSVVMLGILTTALSLSALRSTAPGFLDPVGWSSAGSTQAQAPAVAPAALAPGVAQPAGFTAPRAAAPASQAQAKKYSVMIHNYAYSPAALTVKVGDTVTWTNMDSAPHTVTVTDGPVKFDSGNLEEGDSFSYTFKKAGTYSYYCAVHPDMTGKVTATKGGSQPSPSPSPSPTPSPSPSPGPGHPAPAPRSACIGLQAAADAFLRHFYAAHLEESPSQQVADVLAIDQYVKTHTVLIEHMIKPVIAGSDRALTVFLQHVYAAHLEASPSQQAADILALDQYVKTHTVMIAHMIKPFIGSAGGC